MERIVAVKRLAKIMGKGFGYQINTKAPDPDEREAAIAALPEALKKLNEIEAKKKARLVAILAADTEYQALKAEHAALQQVVEKLNSVKYGRKITVGISNGMFFLVKAEGDNWEEVINKVQNGRGA